MCGQVRAAMAVNKIVLNMTHETWGTTDTADSWTDRGSVNK